MLTLNLQAFNVLCLDRAEFFAYTHEDGLYLLPSNCPHRGGPLRLGSLEGKTIVCPWHGSRVPIQHCISRALPIVVRHYSRELLVPVDESNYASVAFRQREITLGRSRRLERSACSEQG